MTGNESTISQILPTPKFPYGNCSKLIMPKIRASCTKAKINIYHVILTAMMLFINNSLGTDTKMAI